MIYESTQYVDPTKNENWYQLSVINQFDFQTKPIAYRNGMSYCLKLCVSLGNSRSWKTYRVTELTNEMKAELQNKGFKLAETDKEENKQSK